MEIKTFRAASMQAALRLVRRELGPEAAVLRTREVRAGGMLGLLTGERGIEVEASAEVIVPSRLPKRPAILDQGIDLTEMAQLRRSVDHELLEELPLHGRTPPFHIVVAGAATGVGTTTVATNLAATLNRQQLRAMLWNSDHSFEHFTARGRQSVLSADVLLFDVGSDRSKTFDRLWETAGLVLLVVTPDSKSILDGYAAIKQLVERHGRLNLLTVVNSARDAVEADRVHTQLANTCRQFLDLEISSVGYVSRLTMPSLTNFPANAHSQPGLTRKSPAEGNSMVAKQFEQIASRIAIESPINYLRSVSKKNLKFAESAVTAGRY